MKNSFSAFMAIPLFLLPIFQNPQETKYGGSASVTVEHDCGKHNYSKCEDSGKRRVINVTTICRHSDASSAKSDLLGSINVNMSRADVMISSVSYDITSCE
jgi:hypothetical protein